MLFQVLTEREENSVAIASNDVHLAEHTLFVRWSLSAVNNNEL